MITLTPEMLNKLRGIKTDTPKQSDVSEGASGQDFGVKTEQNGTQNSQIDKTEIQEVKRIAPIEISCKNYNDEKGHFAYIDANTHQTFHVNLDTGKVYTMDEVKQLSLQYALKPLLEKDENSSLTWQQVINNDTLFDQFGSPVFTFQEVYSALEKMRNVLSEPKSETIASSEKPKTDPWGFPI